MSKKPIEHSDRQFSAVQTILLFVAVAGIVFVISRFALTRSPRIAGAENPAVGKAAPNVTFAKLTGDQAIKLSEQRGKVVLINFWGTWCPPCRAEFPKLVEVTKPYLPREDFRLISVCVPGGAESQEELAADAKEFLMQQRAAFPALHDPDSAAFNALMKSVGVQRGGIPFTVIIDQQGKFAGIWMGYDSGDEDEVAQVLNLAFQVKATK